MESLDVPGGGMPVLGWIEPPLPSQGVLTQSLEPVIMSPYIRWGLGRMETGVHPLAAL